MRVYASVDDIRLPLARVPAFARRAEALGFDGLIVPEAVGDGILTSLLALEHTDRLHVLTGVVVAFARSPMLLAQDAWELQRMSSGRFELGLGSQVRGNIEGRYGMPWSPPAARMRDYVGALRAIFRCWQEGTPLDYASESYRLTRMQPFFSPGPIEHPAIPIVMGAVGPGMTRAAGAVADAALTHPTNASPGILREVTRPALAEGARRAGRAEGAVGLIANPMTATGATADEVVAEREAARRVLAFTFSTPAYWTGLERLGRAELGPQLREHTRAGNWDGLPAAIDDALLDELVPSGPFGEIAGVLRERYAGLADAISLRMPENPERDRAFAEVVRALRASS